MDISQYASFYVNFPIKNTILSLKDAHKLYTTMKVVSEVLNRFGIEYSLWTGTLLGALRHKGIIPWDDDLDILVFKKDIQLLTSKATISEFNKYGYNFVLEENPYVFHVYRESDPNLLIDTPIIIKDNKSLFSSHSLNHPSGKIFNNGIPFIKSGMCDMFPFEQRGAMYKPCNFKKYDKTDSLSLDMIYPLTTTMFGNIEVSILYKSTDYLKKLYGNDCMTNAILTHKHGTNPSSIQKESIRSDKMYVNLNIPSYVNRSYWDTVYSELNIPLQSQFAEWVVTTLRNTNIHTMADLGCGSGRDTYYFNSNGWKCTGIDQSQTSRVISDTLSFKRDDIIRTIDSSFNVYDMIYLRFVIHSLIEEDQTLLFHKLKLFCKKNTYIAIECRTTNDTMKGNGTQVSPEEWVTDHYRRFISVNTLCKELVSFGYDIKHVMVSKGLAPFKGEDPEVCRIIATV